MDGLKDTVPLGKPYEEFHQMSLFDMFPGMSEEEQEPESVPRRLISKRICQSRMLLKSLILL